MGTVILMMKTQIGLGVLSIPTAFDSLGLVPGVICLCAIAVITTWSDYIVGTFKLNHREVYGIGDAGALMFGSIGRGVLSAAFCLCMYPRSLGVSDLSDSRCTDWIFVCSSGILGISIALNTVSTHGACTAIFSVIAAILGFVFSSVRTLGRVTWLAWIGLPCILIASESTTLQLHDTGTR